MSTNLETVETETAPETIPEETGEYIAPVDPEIEAEARRQGWKPPEEYNGDPSNWRSAEEFLEKSETELPVLRERFRKLSSEMKAMQNAMAVFQQDKESAVRAAREEAEEMYNARLRAAAEDGDMERYDQLEKERAKQRERIPEPTPEDPAVTRFKRANEWFGEEPNMTRYAQDACGVIMENHPEWTPDRVMERVEAMVRQEFPRKFRQSPMTLVEGGRRPLTQPKGETFDNMPQEFKDSFEVSVRHGYISNNESGRDTFAKNYYAMQKGGV